MDSADKTKLQADSNVTPVKISEEDFGSLDRIQAQVDSLAKFRQEMGRLTQLIGNMREEANKVEIALAAERRKLADKYDLKSAGTGQWALDFDKKEFVKTAPGTPTIP